MMNKLEDDSRVDTAWYQRRYYDYYARKQTLRDEYLQTNMDIKTVVNNSRTIMDKSEYLIVEYTKIFGQTKYCQISNKSHANPDLFVNECPYKNCRFTCDKRQVPNADALLFHEADITSEALLDKAYINKVAELHRQILKSVFILWNDEANPVQESLDQIMFNWTLSYRNDAEVSDCAYGCLYEKSVNAYEIYGKQVLIAKHLEHHFKQRDSSAVWFVSNCDSKLRIDFAVSLNEHFPVKVFGKCSAEYSFRLSSFKYFGVVGKLVFNLFNIFANTRCVRDSYCEKENLYSSKFYLAFESKNCTDYITEKFWRVLRHNIVPVVFQPAKKFYLKIAPPNSFIVKKIFNLLIFLKNGIIYFRF